MITLSSLISALLFIIIAGLIWGLLWWLIGYVGLPEPFAKVARVVLAIGAVFILIAILMSLAGHPLIVFDR